MSPPSVTNELPLKPLTPTLHLRYSSFLMGSYSFMNSLCFAHMSTGRSPRTLIGYDFCAQASTHVMAAVLVWSLNFFAFSAVGKRIDYDL